MEPTGAGAAIEASGLCKRFGAVTALSGVDLHLAPGGSLALFGPNGAGKTTLVRILALGLRAESGSLRISGLDPRRDDLSIRRRIGLISHQSYLYDDLTLAQNLEFFGALYGVDDPARRSATLLDSVGLAHRADDPVRGLSRGMQQRVSLVRALVHDPSVVLLDEPFTGLDPHAAEMLRGLLGRLRQQGRTIVLVTHNLRQGLALCESWAVLSRGRVVERGPSSGTAPEEFEARYFDRLGRSAPPAP